MRDIILRAVLANVLAHTTVAGTLLATDSHTLFSSHPYHWIDLDYFCLSSWWSCINQIWSVALVVITGTTILDTYLKIKSLQGRDHSGYGLSQWKMTSQCNVIPHCLISAKSLSKKLWWLDNMTGHQDINPSIDDKPLWMRSHKSMDALNKMVHLHKC